MGGKNRGIQRTQPGTVVHQRELNTFSGPLPPGDHFSAYEQVLPGAAERILGMTEEEQRQRLARQERELAIVETESKAAVDLQRVAVAGAIAAQRRAQWSSFALMVLVCGVGTYAITIGQAGAGAAAIIGALATSAVSFIAKPNSQTPAKAVPEEKPPSASKK